MKKLQVVLIPLHSVAGFLFGSKIDKYTFMKHKYFNDIKDKDYFYDKYKFHKFPTIEVWVNSNKNIDSIFCDKECYLNDVNIVGMHINSFKSKFNQVEVRLEKIYLEGQNRTETVYDFDNLGLQLWTWRKKIVTVIASNNDDE